MDIPRAPQNSLELLNSNEQEIHFLQDSNEFLKTSQSLESVFTIVDTLSTIINIEVSQERLGLQNQSDAYIIFHDLQNVIAEIKSIYSLFKLEKLDLQPALARTRLAFPRILSCFTVLKKLVTKQGNFELEELTSLNGFTSIENSNEYTLTRGEKTPIKLFVKGPITFQNYLQFFITSTLLLNTTKEESITEVRISRSIEDGVEWLKIEDNGDQLPDNFILNLYEYFRIGLKYPDVFKKIGDAQNSVDGVSTEIMDLVLNFQPRGSRLVAYYAGRACAEKYELEETSDSLSDDELQAYFDQYIKLEFRDGFKSIRVRVF